MLFLVHFILFFRGKGENGAFVVKSDTGSVLEVRFNSRLFLEYAGVGRHVVCEPDVATNDGVVPK